MIAWISAAMRAVSKISVKAKKAVRVMKQQKVARRIALFKVKIRVIRQEKVLFLGIIFAITAIVLGIIFIIKNDKKILGIIGLVIGVIGFTFSAYLIFLSFQVFPSYYCRQLK